MKITTFYDPDKNALMIAEDLTKDRSKDLHGPAVLSSHLIGA